MMGSLSTFTYASREESEEVISSDRVAGSKFSMDALSHFSAKGKFSEEEEHNLLKRFSCLKD
jgi:hypothetical protein